ncbi:hypothetical protein ACRE_027630 [Hapsidospora chrysogenum ATCC 11550]|uniref:Uncharacterized protein n=1 Tax=Hapsidospora chrysogenum (strain ATCC 11550 / CBS 779.69 / DSM 880 / IAM 14645 / JCM 23072 / IMI 49137) TaxID=857340 RepID=A0A086TAP0_HAPC1|nr:hypothetical protein ACRE_027630 [Hapsidospora chrysogenum ATCC 11550]
MSQVKNLRAMFENKGDNPSPPDRGRSPGAPWSSGAANSESPRPLSKVRTNFVAIEKNGKIGLQRDPSYEPSPSRGRSNPDMDAKLAPNTTPDAVEGTARKLFPGVAVAESSPNAANPFQSSPASNDVGAVSDKPSLHPDKQVDEEQPTPKLTPADPTEPRSTGASKSLSKDAPTESKPKVEKTSNDAVAGIARKNHVTRPSGTAAKAATKAPSKTAPAPRPTPAAAKRPEARPSARVQDKPPARREATAAGSASAAKSTRSTTDRKPPPVKTSNTGFVKPKPKSPTKPVSLPPSLMAPTASSVSKGAATRQSLSRQSGSLRPPSAAARAPSRASVSTATGPTKTIKRQASSINRPRPSLGLPPKKASEDHPITKKDSQVDESFLARMMRPTQSSSSKTHEKVPTTPPRKSVTRPSTSNTNASSRRASSVKRQLQTTSPASGKLTSPNLSDAAPATADVAPRTAETGTEKQAVPAPLQQGEQVADHQQGEDGASGEAATILSTEGDVSQGPSEIEEASLEAEAAVEAAPETAHVETADEVVELAGEADLVQIPVEPSAEPEVVPEVAPETAQVETAEEVADLAEKADLIQTPVEPVDAESQGETLPEVETGASPKEEADGLDEIKPSELPGPPHEPPSPEPSSQADASAEKVLTPAPAEEDIRVAEEETVVENSGSEPIAEAQGLNGDAVTSAAQEESSNIHGAPSAEANDADKI